MMKIAKFVRWCITEGCFAGCDLDGGSVQDMAVECGIIKPVKYDPKAHGPNNVGAEAGDDWFVFSDKFKATR